MSPLTTSLHEAVVAAVAAVPDPELAGVEIGDLGLVESVTVDDEAGTVTVELVPTFLGCPALEVIECDVRRAIETVTPAHRVTVRFVSTPAWSPERISTRGREQLGELAIAVADQGVRFESVSCPVCGVCRLRTVSAVGPTACRSVAWCDACRNPIEIVRR